MQSCRGYQTHGLDPYGARSHSNEFTQQASTHTFVGYDRGAGYRIPQSVEPPWYMTRMPGGAGRAPP